MKQFTRGDRVRYVSPRGNIYKGTVKHCFGPDTPSTILGAPNACIFNVEEKKIIDDVEYEYPIGSERLVHKSRLENDTLLSMINSKRKSMAVRNVYESMTNQSGKPGNGPANIIRNFSGIRVPKGAQGGRRRTLKKRKDRRRHTRK